MCPDRARARLGVDLRKGSASSAHRIEQVLLAVERAADPGGVARLHEPPERILVREAPERDRGAGDRGLIGGVAEAALARAEASRDTLVLCACAQPHGYVGRSLLSLGDGIRLDQGPVARHDLVLAAQDAIRVRAVEV